MRACVRTLLAKKISYFRILVLLPCGTVVDLKVEFGLEDDDASEVLVPAAVPFPEEDKLSITALASPMFAAT